MFLNVLFAVLSASAAMAHSNMFLPTPRKNQDSAYTDRGQNACGNGGTDIPQENTFARGQPVDVKWWWNNHDGGFIKMSLVKGVPDFADAKVQDAFNDLKNTLQFQCYTGDCDRSGFDPGQTKVCNGKPMVIPDWVEDGEYVLQWSQYAGFNSEAVATRQLPNYHTCANIRIAGGTPLQKQPANWIPPFLGGDQVEVNGQKATKDQCAFKRFIGLEPDPSKVDVKNDDASLIHFGTPLLATLDSVDLVANNLFANGGTPTPLPAGGNGTGNGPAVIAIPGGEDPATPPAAGADDNAGFIQRLKALLAEAETRFGGGASKENTKRDEGEVLRRLGRVARRRI